MVDKKITVTRDVEVIEMTDLGIGTTWNVSTMAKEPTSWFAGFQRSERRREKTMRHGSIRPIMRNGHYDVHAANAKTATTPLARELKGRHLQMIAFGGSIGTGLFVASGAGLYHAGPAGLLLAYIGVGALLYCTMQSLCELSVLFPVAGSFMTFTTRFLDPSWGFAISWVYFLQWLMVLPLEIIAAVLTISYWNEVVPKAVFVTIFLVLIIAINMSGIRFYGETEFVFAIIKIVAIIGFILLGIVINIGGPPDGGFIGGKLWFQPQPFNNGFKGFSSALTTALFSYGGTEMIGLAVAETRDPRKSFPKAIKQVFWRIAIFYLITIMLVGLLVPSDNPSLIGGKSSADASASAFVIAIESAGATILPSVMNGVILIAVLSVGNSAVYGASRALEAMAELSHAPQLFTYIDKRGRPLVSLFIAGCVGLLAYTIDVKVHDTIFQWLLSISAVTTIFTWSSICFCHIRLRLAWTRAARPLSRLPFLSSVGVVGSWCALLGYILVLALHTWVSISPIEIPGTEINLSGHLQYFFLRMMALPVVLFLFLLHKLRFRTNFMGVGELDIDTGRRPYRFYPDKEEEEAEKRRNWPFWRRAYDFIC